MLILEPCLHDEDVSSLKVMLAIISDKALAATIAQFIPQETSYVVLVVEDSYQALEVIREIVPDLLLLDYHLQGIDGITLYAYLHTLKGLRETPALIINTPMVSESVWNATRTVICLEEPFVQDELLVSIEKLAASRRAVPRSHVTCDTEGLETPFSMKWINEVRQ
ncbi:MAG TPA: response regulator [Ktedonobacteraceae bacterium]|nr:response regulator [Ktedonobacteraceae bacterium]